VSFFAPIIGAALGNAAGGRESAKCGVLMALGVVAATWAGAGLVTIVKRHFADTRARREQLAAMSRYMPSKPSLAGPVMCAIFLLLSAPLLLATTAVVAQLSHFGSPSDRAGVAIIGGVMMLVTLSAQWLGWRRLSIYMHERKAWREWRKPFGRDGR
jgi:hypothetical protein